MGCFYSYSLYHTIIPYWLLEARAERFKLLPLNEGALPEKRFQLDITYPSIQHLKWDRNLVFLSDEDKLSLTIQHKLYNT